MPQNTHIETIESAVERTPQGAKESAPDLDRLSGSAAEGAQLLAWNPSVQSSPFFTVRWNAMAVVLRPILEKLKQSRKDPSETDDGRWLLDNLPLLWSHFW